MIELDEDIIQTCWFNHLVNTYPTFLKPRAYKEKSSSVAQLTACHICSTANACSFAWDAARPLLMLKTVTAKDRYFSLSSFPLLFSGLSSEIFGQLKIDDKIQEVARVFWGAIWALEIFLCKDTDIIWILTTQDANHHMSPFHLNGSLPLQLNL